MISTPFWTGTGFMKWQDTTREAVERSVGFSLVVVAAAILVMLMLEVLVARMACEGHMVASWEKICCFRLGISGTASITKSTSERADISVVAVSRDRVAFAISSVILFFETSLARSLSAKAMPLSSDFWELSTSVTWTSAFWAATRAIPRPCEVGQKGELR